MSKRITVLTSVTIALSVLFVIAVQLSTAAADGTYGAAPSTTFSIARDAASTSTGPNAVQLQDLSAQSENDLSQNLGWLFAMIVLGASGFAGLMKANRHQPRPTAHWKRN